MDIAVLVKLIIEAGFSVTLLAFFMIEKRVQTARQTYLENRIFEIQKDSTKVSTQVVSTMTQMIHLQEQQTRATQELSKLIERVECHKDKVS